MSFLPSNSRRPIDCSPPLRVEGRLGCSAHGSSGCLYDAPTFTHVPHFPPHKPHWRVEIDRRPPLLVSSRWSDPFVAGPVGHTLRIHASAWPAASLKAESIFCLLTSTDSDFSKVFRP